MRADGAGATAARPMQPSEAFPMNDCSPFQTAWVRRLRLGERPSALDLREHLLAVHRENAGFTEACAGRCRDAAGRTSYQWLSEVVEPGRHRRVLDLACGSGRLLSLCVERFAPGVAFLGVDMSAEELALARERLPAGAAELRQGLAQDLGFLADGSVDAVLCHWALTLMDPVRPVLEEVRRVLAPGGVFAAIVDGDMAAAAGYAEIHHLIYGWVQRELALYGEVDLGDPRVRDRRALGDLVGEVFGGDAGARIETGVMRLAGTPDALAREAAGFFYASFVLSPEAREAMLAELAALIADRAAGAPPAFEMPISRLVVQRP